MTHSTFLKIYDTNQMFKAVLVSDDGIEKEIYLSDDSLTKLLSKFSKILGVSDFLQIVNYGDELFHEFFIDTIQTDFLNISHFEKQLTDTLTSKKSDIAKQGFADELLNELQDHLTLDLAASIFDASIAQMLVYVLNLAKEINIEKIEFSSPLMHFPRFKKLISDEFIKYGFTLA